VSTGDDAYALLEQLPDGVVAVGGDGVVEFVNGRAATRIGRASADLVGRAVTDALPLLDGAGQSWWELSDPWGGPAIRTGHRERMLLLPGQGHLLVTMQYIREEHLGPVTRVFVALRDTDARRRTEAENAELISLVAHELRAPLASVKGFSTTLLRRWDRFSDDQKHLMIETIEADAERLSRLIHELLDVSHLDTRRLRLERDVVDLGELLGRCVERFVASGLDPSRFDLQLDSASPAIVWGDADRLDQVVSNLLENAVRHGGGTVHLRVAPVEVAREGATTISALDADRPMWEVAVYDEGEGIRPENYSLVFSKFWHGSRRGSTGLGLYLARGLVEAHGGVITVGREPDAGARFTFTLPSAPDALTR